MISEKLTFAVQKSGRLREQSLEYLKSQGYRFSDSSDLLLSTESFALLSIRDDDIPEYVYRDVADFGIVGENTLYEKGLKLQVLKRLGFSKCSLMIAIPEKSQISTVNDLQGLRIATSYPNLLRKFLNEQGIFSSIICLEGAVEVAPSLNMSDAICDLVQSGKTLRANGLRPLIEVMKTEAVLVSNPKK